MKVSVVGSIAIFLFSCTPKNILSYRARPFYKENDSYQYYSNSIILRQSIRYDNPRSNDEEHAFGVTFFIRDSVLLSGKRSFDLSTDAISMHGNCQPCNPAAIHYFQQVPGHSFSESSAYKLVGQMEILKWDSSSVVLKQNIRVVDSSLNVIRWYKGSRLFLRNTGDLKVYFD